MGSYHAAAKLRATLETDPCRPLPFKFMGPAYRLFKQHAQLHPLAAALCSNMGTWTYGELDELSDRFAGCLKCHGVGRGKTVALYSDRNPALICAILAVLKSGATFFVADAAYPAARTKACIALAKPSMMLICCSVACPKELLAISDNDRILDSFCLPASVAAARLALARYERVDCCDDIRDTDVAYLGFTSGSTGVPKCVATSHAPLPHFIDWHVRTHGLKITDRFSFLSGLSHDPALRDIFTPLSLGAPLHIPEQAAIFDPSRLSAWLAEQHITVVHLTPAMGQIIAAGAHDDDALNEIRYFFWGGDVLNSKLSRRMQTIAPNSRQIGFYGATETPQAMSSCALDPLAQRDGALLGKGIDDVQLLIVAEGNRLAHCGETGEIFVRTPYLSLGYFNDDEQTRKRYVPNPFTNDPRDRCYRTGDLGKYLPGGEVVFEGRADHQVKIRGFRVELDEVTANVERHPGVARAVVLACDLGRDSKVLVAYYTCDTGCDVRSDSLSHAARTVLPCYMVPSYFVKLENFPLLPNGKIDLRALPSPTDIPVANASTSGQPSTPREKELAQVWREILRVENVSVNSSFLEMGGDSLSAISALLSMERLGIPEELARGVLQGKTIAQIVRDEQSGADARTAPAPLTGSAKAGKLVNVLRGILVTIVVADHWLPGLLKRLPHYFAGLLDALAVLFNVATPGFAFVFGIGLGFNYLAKFKQHPAQVKRMLNFGLLLVGISVAVSSGLELAAAAAKGKELTYTSVCVAPYGSLLYYFLALATAPLWFRIVGRFRNPPVATLGLMALFYVVHRVLVDLLLAREQTGILQLTRLMLVAKFNYFNMSIGALGGMSLGAYLADRRSIEGLFRRSMGLGTVLVLSGLSLVFLEPTRMSALADGANMHLWRWFFFIGVLLMATSVLAEALERSARLPVGVQIALNLTAAIGQCALPIFVLHKVALQTKTLLDTTGLPDTVALLISLAAFGVINGRMIARIYRLYYSGMSARLQFC